MTTPTELALKAQQILEESGTPGVIAQTVARVVYAKIDKTKSSNNSEGREIERLHQCKNSINGVRELYFNCEAETRFNHRR